MENPKEEPKQPFYCSDRLELDDNERCINQCDVCGKKPKEELYRLEYNNDEGIIGTEMSTKQELFRVEIDWTKFPQSIKESVGYVEPKQEFERDITITHVGQPLQETLEEKLDKIVSKEPSKFWIESNERFKNKETLEEAAENYISDSLFKIEEKRSFIDGAEWQSERSISKEAYEDSLSMQICSNAGYESKIMELENQIKLMYIEEEVFNLLDKHSNDVLSEHYNDGVLNNKKWFEQFKKK